MSDSASSEKSAASKKRFTLQELSLATLLAAIPLSGHQAIGIWSALSFALMGFSLTIGRGILAMFFMGLAFVAVAVNGLTMESISLSLCFALIIAAAPKLWNVAGDAFLKSRPKN